MVSIATRFLAIFLVGLALAPIMRSQQQPSGADWYVQGTHPNLLLVIDGSKDEIAFQIVTHGRSPKELVPAPDGKRVYVTTDGRQKIEVINLVSRKVEEVINLAQPAHRITIYGMAFSRDGRELFVHVKPVRELPDEYKVEPPEIIALDLGTKKTRKIAEVPHGTAALVALKDGKRLVAWGRDLYFIDLASGKIVDTYPLQGVYHAPGRPQYNTLPLFAQHDRSGVLAFPYFSNDPITKKDVFGYVNLDVDTGAVEVQELGPPVSLYSFVVSPDRKREYGVGVSQLVTVDLAAKKVIDLRDQERTQYVANISSDGKKLYLGGAGPHMFVYDTTTLKTIKTIELPGDGSGSQFRAIPPPM
jgi:hypothetical protein